MKLKKGDVLIERKTLKCFPVIDVFDGVVYMEAGNKRLKRALGQIVRHRKHFDIIRAGQKILKDYAFYCPKSDRMIVLKEGTVFLGEF